MEKKINKNEGEVQQYYVEGNLEVIIIFDLVLELARRNQRGSHYSGVSVFFNKIRCADCGSWYGSKVWNSTDAYKKPSTAATTNTSARSATLSMLWKAVIVSVYNQLVSKRNHRQRQNHPVDTLCDHGLSGRESGHGSPGGNDTEHRSGKYSHCTVPGRIPKKLQRLGGMLQCCKGTIR